MPHDQHIVDLLRNALRDLRFGEVKIAVHDGEVVQVERTERLRPTRVSAPDDDATD